MPIRGVDQPDIIDIDDELRLVRFRGNYHDNYQFTLSFYQDLDTMWLVDGDQEPYTEDTLSDMYAWLDGAGELYFIEVLEAEKYLPVGDVTFWQTDMPIVIWDPKYRGRGIASKVIGQLVERGRDLGYTHLEVEEIYDWNPASHKAFTRQGFKPVEKTDKGYRYRLDLE